LIDFNQSLSDLIVFDSYCLLLH